MSGLSGDEVLTELRERGYDCPVAMLTAVNPGEDILELDGDSYFVKPLDWAELREAVASLTARARERRGIPGILPHRFEEGVDGGQ